MILGSQFCINCIYWNGGSDIMTTISSIEPEWWLVILTLGWLLISIVSFLSQKAIARLVYRISVISYFTGRLESKRAELSQAEYADWELAIIKLMSKWAPKEIREITNVFRKDK